MRRWLIPGVSVACLLAALVVPAAGQDRKTESDPRAAELEVFTRYVHGMGLEEFNRLANEEIEILGEVIRTALEKLYARLGTVHYIDGSQEVSISVRPGPYRQRGVPADTMPFPTFGARAFTVERPEGVYLPGYGVVYQVGLNVPSPEEKRSEVLAGKADKSRIVGGAWENAQRTLRGQPPEPLGIELDYGVPTKDDLVNKLLDVLAENAGNFRHLKPEDRLTVAITFPRSKPSAASYGGYYEEQGGAVFGAEGAAGDEYDEGHRGEGGARYSSYEDEYSSSAYGTAPPIGASLEEGEYGFDMDDYGDAASTRYGSRTPRRGAGSQEVAGDLHLRQQEYVKAIEAYGKALDSVRRSPSQRRRLSIKYIQAHVAAGELEKARALIEKALAAKPKADNGDAPPEAPRTIPLPARLVVSVTKSQLDEVAAGKMTREELQKSAGGYYFNPPPGTPGLGARKSRPPSGGQGSRYGARAGTY